MSNAPVPMLYWDSPYAIALALLEHHPNLHPEHVGLSQLATLVVALPGFKDDLAFVTNRLLLDIQSEWYEEISAR